jgi:hypothetical protein
MRTIALIMIIIAISSGFTFGQTPQDTISVVKLNRGYQYFKEDKQLNIDEIAFAVRSNEVAYQMVKSAQANNTLGMVLGYAGGFMIGWPIGTALGGGDPNWTIAGVGVAVAILGFSVGSGSQRKVKEAVDMYNAGLGTVYLRDPSVRGTELRLSLTEFGIGLTLNF